MQSARKITTIPLEIQKIQYLPPLPVIAQQLINELNSEDSSITTIAAIIDRDPPLTSRIVGLANSAFFGCGSKLYSVQEAIVSLGLDLVRSLALTRVMGGVFDNNKCKGFDISRYWLSAYMTAELTRDSAAISGSSKHASNRQYFLYGLLHNLGVLVLTHAFPKLMGEIYSVVKGHQERRLVITEQAMLDIDHHQAGGWLARKWHLPGEVIAVIEHHHFPDYAGTYREEVLLTGFCSRTARNWIIGKETLICEEPETLALLDINRTDMENTATKCRARLEDFRSIALEMCA